jgi:hypothetical protein
MKMFIEMFFMIFQSSMSPGKLRCDVFSGTTQGDLNMVKWTKKYIRPNPKF